MFNIHYLCLYIIGDLKENNIAIAIAIVLTKVNPKS